MKEKLRDSMKQAMKTKDKVRLGAIRSLLSAIQYAEMEKGTDELPASVVIAVLQSEAKKLKESLEFAKKEDRTEMISSLEAEIAIIESFLPAQLSAEELGNIITTLKDSNPDANLGLVMKALKEDYSGQYDGKLASEIARKIL